MAPARPAAPGRWSRRAFRCPGRRTGAPVWAGLPADRQVLPAARGQGMVRQVDAPVGGPGRRCHFLQPLQRLLEGAIEVGDRHRVHQWSLRLHPARDLELEVARRPGDEDEKQDPADDQTRPRVQPGGALAKTFLHDLSRISLATAMSASGKGARRGGGNVGPARADDTPKRQSFSIDGKSARPTQPEALVGGARWRDGGASVTVSRSRLDNRRSTPALTRLTRKGLRP